MPESLPLPILWITPRLPLGAPDGARHATATLIDQLTRQGAKLEIVSIIASDESADLDGVKKTFRLSRCVVVRRSLSRWKRFPSLFTPFTFRAYGTPAVRAAVMAEVNRFVAENQKSVVIVDGLHPFASFDEGWLAQHKSLGCQVIYRAHNYETALWEQHTTLTATPLTWLFFKHQAVLVKRFERQVAALVEGIAPVSAEDGSRFLKLAPETPIMVTPIGMDFSSEILPASAESSTLTILFVGRLDWIPNRSGLTWFLKEVWPRVIAKRPNATIEIAGVGDGKWLETFKGLSGVRLLGRVERLEPLYAACTLTIAPLFQGSGTRVKILESARYHRAVLSSALGAEGTGLVSNESFFSFEDADGWVDFLATAAADHCKAVGEKAYKSVRERFDSATIAMQLLAFLSRH